MNKNKVLLLVIILLPIMLLASQHTEILLEDADVNPVDGHSCIAYYDEDKHLIVLESFDEKGERTFVKELDSEWGGFVRVRYMDGLLNVYISRSKDQYVFDSAGNEVGYLKRSIPDEISPTGRFETFGGKNQSYKLGQREYCYEETSCLSAVIGVGYVKFYIKEPDGNIKMLYENSI